MVRKLTPRKYCISELFLTILVVISKWKPTIAQSVVHPFGPTASAEVIQERDDLKDKLDSAVSSAVKASEELDSITTQQALGNSKFWKYQRRGSTSFDYKKWQITSETVYKLRFNHQNVPKAKNMQF